MQSTRRKFHLISLEGGILAFSLFALANGILRGDTLSIFWGGICGAGLVVLFLVRRRDWGKHWEEMERMEKIRNGRDGSGNE